MNVNFTFQRHLGRVAYSLAPLAGFRHSLPAVPQVGSTKIAVLNVRNAIVATAEESKRRRNSNRHLRPSRTNCRARKSRSRTSNAAE